MTRRRLAYLVLLLAMFVGDGFVCASQGQAGLFQSASIASVQPEADSETTSAQHDDAREQSLNAEQAPSQHSHPSLAVARLQQPLSYALFQRPPPSSIAAL